MSHRLLTVVEGTSIPGAVLDALIDAGWQAMANRLLDTGVGRDVGPLSPDISSICRRLLEGAPPDGTWEALVTLWQSDEDSTTVPVVDRPGLWLFTEPNDVDEVGGAVFCERQIGVPKFASDQTMLLRQLYLPTQLAKDGKGVFFEERIADRLAQLGLVASDQAVESIEDIGGWESHDRLTASILVGTVRAAGDRTSLRLDAEALVPPPPLRPEQLCRELANRIAFFKLLGVPTSALRCEEGVLYSVGGLKPVQPALREAGSRAEELGHQLGRLLGMLHAGVFRHANSMSILDATGYAAVEAVGLSTVGDAHRLAAPLAVELFATDGVTVFVDDVTRVSRDPGRFSESDLSQVLPGAAKGARTCFVNAYRDALAACLDPQWLRRRLSARGQD